MLNIHCCKFNSFLFLDIVLVDLTCLAPHIREGIYASVNYVDGIELAKEETSSSQYCIFFWSRCNVFYPSQNEWPFFGKNLSQNGYPFFEIFLFPNEFCPKMCVHILMKVLNSPLAAFMSQCAFAMLYCWH